MNTFSVKHTISKDTYTHEVIGYSPVIIRDSDGCVIAFAYDGHFNEQPHEKTQKKSIERYEKKQRLYSDEYLEQVKNDPKQIYRGYEHLIKII